MMQYGNWNSWQFGLSALVMIALLALLIWVAYTVTNGSHGAVTQPQSGDARGVLDVRLARGEIDPEEYARLRALMTASDAPLVDV